MTKIQVNSQGKAYISSGGKALLSTGGGSATLITKTITQNGTYNASSDNADGYSSVTVNVGGTPTPTGKYQLFERVKDDRLDDGIGTVCGFFHDANNVEYAVVVLDATFRNKNLKYSSLARAVTDLPVYTGSGDFIKLITNVYTNTATYNCDKLKAWCTSRGETSTALDHCRHYDFIIDNVTYYGQIPNIYELFQIALNHERLGSLDPSEESYSDYTLTTFPSGRNIVGSDQGDGEMKCGVLYCPGGVTNWNMSKTTDALVYPVLEIPNAL